MKHKKLTLLLLIISLGLASTVFYIVHRVAAQTVDYSMTLERNGAQNCPVIVNGSPAPNSIHISQGDTLNIALTNAMNYPMNTPQVWLRAQYDLHAGSAYSPIGSLSYDASTGEWSGSFDDVRQDLVVVATFGVGETCLDGSDWQLSYIYADAPPSENPPASSGGQGSAGPPTSASGGARDTGTPAEPQPTASVTQLQVETVTIDGKVVDVGKVIHVGQSQPLVVSGATTPNATVNLTIHSTPKTAMVKADTAGHWSYTITGLASGPHYIEASAVDPTTGKASTPTKILSFTVDKSSDAPNQLLMSHRAKHVQWPWIAAGAVMVLVALGAVAFILCKKGRRGFVARLTRRFSKKK